MGLDMDKPLKIQPIPLFSSKIQAGFPSPATDYVERSLDLNELCIKHPAATFFAVATGYSMITVGIYPDDILIIDKSLEPRDKDIVVAAYNGQFTVKRLIKAPVLQLMPENDEYEPIIIQSNDEFEIFGVVTNCIRRFRP